MDPLVVDLFSRFQHGFRVHTAANAGEAYCCEMGIANETLHAIFLCPPHEIEFDLPNVDMALHFAIAISPYAWDQPGAGACRFIVAVNGADCFSETIDPVSIPADRCWHSRVVPLPRQGDGNSRLLRLRTEAVGGPHCRWALWGRPTAVSSNVGRPASGFDAWREDVELEQMLHAAALDQLRSLPNRKLNLGCGNFPLAGWTNIDSGDRFFAAPSMRDVVRLGVFEALAALPPHSVDFITSEQFFEHFTRQQGYAMMQECHRVLCPGGVVRIQVPDLDATVRLYRNEIDFADWERVQLPHRMKHIGGSSDPYAVLLPGETYTPAIMLNNGFHMDGHKFLYDFQTLQQTLTLAGFRSVCRERYAESRHDALRGIDHHDGGETGRTWLPQLALIVEATA